MELIKKNGFQIATSKAATQLIINCHGSWDRSYGYTSVPAKTKLYFYTKHGDFTLGTGVVDAVLSNPHEAKVGLKKTLSPAKQQEIDDGFSKSVASLISEYRGPLGILQSDIDAVLKATDARARQTAERHLASKLEESLKAKKTAQSTIDGLLKGHLNPQRLNRAAYVAEESDKALKFVCSLYDGFGAGRPIFNYFLAMETEAVRKKIDFDAKLEKHLEGKTPGVDLLQVYKSDPVYLNDAFKTLEKVGLSYEVIHFGACRFVQAKLPTG
jgi:hypothetical protein